jgi:long-chain-fatty-acid---luciferin-component ligase
MELATMLGAPGTALRLPQEQAEAGLVQVLQSAFAYHFDRNAFFRAQCDAVRVRPEQVRTRQDLALIPLLSVSMFKRPDAHVLLTAPLAEIEMEIRSTGTGGVPSVARRDSPTVTRAITGIVGSYREFFEVSKGAGLFLCPSTAETPEMGMVKVFNMLNGLFDDRIYVVRDYAFDPDEALEYLRRWNGEMTRHIVGPPFLVNRLLRYLELEEIQIELDPESLVITLGGWKRYTGESISREDFDDKLHRYLGVSPDRVRDMYGMIESNMVAVECEHHNKHVPPWCYISIRDVSDPTVEVPSGQTGLIAILDATNTSYPGFLLSDDVGEISDTACACGRTGQTVSFRRRRQGAELGCCAVSIEKFIDSQEIVAECAAPAPAPAPV